MPSGHRLATFDSTSGKYPAVGTQLGRDAKLKDRQVSEGTKGVGRPPRPWSCNMQRKVILGGGPGQANRRIPSNKEPGIVLSIVGRGVPPPKCHALCIGS